MFQHAILDSLDLHFLPVKHPSGKCCLDIGRREDFREVFGHAGATASDDWNRYRLRHGPHQGDVESFALPVHVDAVQHDFSRTQCLDRLGHRDGTNIPRLAPALHGALVPAPPLAVGTGAGLVEFHRHMGRVNVRLGRRVHMLRVDGYHDRLDPVHARDLLNGRVTGFCTFRGHVVFGSVHGVAAQADLDREREKYSVNEQRAPSTRPAKKEPRTLSAPARK